MLVLFMAQEAYQRVAVGIIQVTEVFQRGENPTRHLEENRTKRTILQKCRLSNGMKNLLAMVHMAQFKKGILMSHKTGAFTLEDATR